jgi:hypothetical protein
MFQQAGKRYLTDNSDQFDTVSDKVGKALTLTTGARIVFCGRDKSTII